MKALELRSRSVLVLVSPEHGGRIAQLEVAGQQLLRGPEFAHLGWLWWGAFPLVPWSNRIPDGKYTFEGRELSVPVNHSDGTAIHGLGASRPWKVDAADDRSALLSLDAAEGPYVISAQESFRLGATGLDLELSVTNVGAQRVPVGLGIHPWFSAAPIRVPAQRYWPGTGAIPEGEPIPVGPEEDLRELREPPEMDRCYTGLTGTTADIGRLRIEWSGPVTQVVVYTGTQGWVCVEPVTMANNGFRLAAEGVAGTGVIALDPGDTVAVAYRFSWPEPL